jgi:hypothetical protein
MASHKADLARQRCGEIVWPMFGACKALKSKEKDRFFELCWPMSWPICARPQLVATHHAVSCSKMTEHRPQGDLARRTGITGGGRTPHHTKKPAVIDIKSMISQVFWLRG